MGSRIVRLNATDADVSDASNLVYAIVEPITAVNKDGKRVEDEDSRFKTFFKVRGMNRLIDTRSEEKGLKTYN